ncbi:MAG: hypothetical protein Q8R16_04140, partial [bacterium]|nr:hypothetical protein [bacterium]
MVQSFDIEDPAQRIGGRDQTAGRVGNHITAVLSELEQMGVGTIRFEVPNGVPRPPRSSDAGTADVIVCVRSTPTDAPAFTRDDLVLVRTAFGVRLHATVADGLQPSGRGISVMDDEGHVVAEVLPAGSGLPCYVYILFNITARSFDGQRALLREVIGRALLRVHEVEVTRSPIVVAEGTELVTAEFPVLGPPQPLPVQPLSADREQQLQAAW